MNNVEASSLPIGVFDSGLGGLSVMRKIKELMPNEKILYFADTARVPYGDKSFDTIIQYSIENSEFLIKRGIKMLVIACHTASVCAVDKLQSLFSLPIIAITDAAIYQLQRNPKLRRAALLGTEKTISSRFYQTKIKALFPQLELTALPCPLFVPLIEEGMTDREKTNLVIRQTLKPLEKIPLDALILACTHFPFLIPELKMHLGEKVPFLDPAHDCALLCKKVLIDRGIQTLQNEMPQDQFFVSGHLEKFKRLGEKFLKTSIEKIELSSEALV